MSTVTYPTKEVEGKPVPEVTFHNRTAEDWDLINSKEFFKGKNVVAFSLPGAFTPTCSTSHLPRYEQLAKAFKANGVDEIVCLSVNDGFVMKSWGEDQKITEVKLLADGAGEFTRGMGMLCDKSAIGFGDRSWRYSMYVKDGVVDKVFSEPMQEGDPFVVSDADTMFKYVCPDAKIPPSTLLYVKKGCPFCHEAMELLTKKGFSYETVVVGEDVSSTALRAVANAATVPQVFMDGKLIGGADDLKKHFA
eukprot:CAMPEP_0203749624 /NCGR_PEP_ID=MMETSP0098-20131031/4110_1 /ASSEMBLY_ACC=CAM_ASM_000208 /TAXON_ID=96639 /ORGANISM=" , Strain NY0313808BC1" /LENGTH=248 /DNA_ID=CAMNT_0050638709 /DNA_START=597 /DNA_END=1343 /DNA_ORIENTATION=-